MPEGDTVHKIAGYLRPRLLGVAPVRVEVGGRSLAWLGGRTIEEVRSHGKHLFIRFADGTILRSHLGMHGSWHRYPAGRPWKRSQRRASIVLDATETVYVCFDAEEVELLRSGSVRERQIAARLGPDLIPEDADLDAVMRRARAIADPGAPVVDLLLDQRVAAGIGNVYKSELLFLHGIHPRAACGALGDSAVRALFANAAELLRGNTGPGPRTTREGEGGLWVYHRRGLPCFRCGAAIRYVRMGKGNRSTYWCDVCQPGG